MEAGVAGAGEGGVGGPAHLVDTVGVGSTVGGGGRGVGGALVDIPALPDTRVDTSHWSRSVRYWALIGPDQSDTGLSLVELTILEPRSLP